VQRVVVVAREIILLNWAALQPFKLLCNMACLFFAFSFMSSTLMLLCTTPVGFMGFIGFMFEFHFTI
jgi:hypothetical protein